MQSNNHALIVTDAKDGANIRTIEAVDNAALAAIIRSVMPEFGAVGEGYAIVDPEVDYFYETYSKPRSTFFVIEQDGRVIGGGGIAPLKGGDEDMCELQKMYFLPEARGLGLGQEILNRSVEAAKAFGFKRMYLETLEHMQTARGLYEKNGFEKQPGPLGSTGHHKCNAWYVKDLCKN